MHPNIFNQAARTGDFVQITNQENAKQNFWIEHAALLVRKYGKNLSSRIASVYRTTWPTGKIPVEVVLYANWAGAYTTTYDTLITVSSVDPANQGEAGLEILFHEASHALIESVQEALLRWKDILRF